MCIEFYRIKKQEDFIQFETDWKKLEKALDMTVYQSLAWNKLLFEEWHNDYINRLTSQIYVVVGRDSEKNVLIIPVIYQKIKYWGQRKTGIYLLGYGSYSDYLNVIYDTFPISLFDECIIKMKEKFGTSILFNSIVEDTKLSQHLLKKYKVFNRNVSVAIKIRSKDEYEASLSKHTRQNLRTALNRMNKDEMNYSWEEHGVLKQELAEKLVNLHIGRLPAKMKEENNTIMKRIKSYYFLKKRTHKEQTNNIILKSMTNLSNSICVIVKLKDEIVGYIYGLKEDNDVIRIMQNCIDEKYKYYSPTFRMIYDYIIGLCETGKIKEIDFTRGKEEYKYKLAGYETQLLDFLI